MNYLFIYLYTHEGKWQGFCFVLFYFLLRAKKNTYCTNSSEHTQGLNLGVEREKLIEPGFSHHHRLSVFLDTSGARKWLSMGLIKVNISSIAFLLHVLMSTCDPMWFKSFSTTSINNGKIREKPIWWQKSRTSDIHEQHIVPVCLLETSSLRQNNHIHASSLRQDNHVWQS